MELIYPVKGNLIVRIHCYYVIIAEDILQIATEKSIYIQVEMYLTVKYAVKREHQRKNTVFYVYGRVGY